MEESPQSKTLNTHKKKGPKTPKLSRKIETTIRVIEEEPGKTPPIIGYFPSGFDPFANKNPDNLPSVTTYRNQKKPKRIELVIRPPGSRVDYVGTNYSGEAAAGKLGVYRLAVVDKVAKTISFVPIVSGKVFRLEPKVTKADMPVEEAATSVKDELTYAERRERLDAATEIFGTKQAKKQAVKALRLRQLDDAEAKKEMDQILENTHADKTAIESSSTGANNDIPPHDVSADSPANIYPLNKIILSGEWDYLNDIFQLLQTEEDLKPELYPSFVRNRTSKVVLLKDEEEKKKVAGIMSYITHLVNFKNKHSLDGFKSAPQHKIPSMLFMKFSKLFVDDNKKRIADDKIGAILSYVLVLTLHIDEFETDFSDIAKDLKMSTVSLRLYLENLGCKLKGQNKATLSAPLEFPTVRRKRRRG